MFVLRITFGRPKTLYVLLHYDHNENVITSNYLVREKGFLLSCIYGLSVGDVGNGTNKRRGEYTGNVTFLEINT